MIKISYFKRIFVMPLLVVLTLGFILLFCHWSISLKKMLLFSETGDLENATHVYVYASRKQAEIVELNKGEPKRLKKSLGGNKYFRGDSAAPNDSKFSFNFRFTKYFYFEPKGCFIPVEFDYYISYSSLLDTYSSGISEGETHAIALDQYGKCNIELPEKSLFALLLEGVLSPFYIFQMFSVALWFIDNYEIFATCILLTSIVSMSVELYELKKNFKNLKAISHYECPITVKRIGSNGEVKYRQVSSDELVPGDIIIVPENMKMPCDAIQLTGSSITNESMLTGESVPVIKNPLPNLDTELYDPEESKNYTLFSGTEVIQNRTLGGKEVTALVIRTNFNTMKGSLIKSILYPKPNRFSFYADSMKFVGVLAILPVIGYFATLHISLKYLNTKEIIFKGLNLVTVAVPPALPAAMSAGVVFTVGILRKGNIFSIDPKRIDVAGRVKTIVFDKTGTLTEDSLQFASVTCVEHDSFGKEISDVKELASADHPNEHIEAKAYECMITCHSIAQVKNQFIGDPLDIEMFKATKWRIDEVENSKESDIVELARFGPELSDEEKVKDEATMI